MKKLMSEIHAARAKECMDKSVACAKAERLKAAKAVRNPTKAAAKTRRTTPKTGRSGQRKAWLALIAAGIIGAGLLATPQPASAWYDYNQDYYYDDGGAAIAGAFAGFALGAIIAGAAQQPRYYTPAYGYPQYQPRQRCWIESRPWVYNYNGAFAGYRPTRVCQ